MPGINGGREHSGLGPDEVSHRPYRRAVRENPGFDDAGGNMQMFLQHALEQAAEIGRWHQVTAFIKVTISETGPVRDHLSTVDSAPEEQRRSRRSVIGAITIV